MGPLKSKTIVKSALFLILPAFVSAGATNKSLISSFESGVSKAKAEGQGKLGLAEGSPFEGGKSSLVFEGRGKARLLLELASGGAGEGGPRLDFSALSPANCLSFDFQAAKGARFEVRLKNSLPQGGSSWLIESKEGGWQEQNLGLGLISEAGAIEITPLDESFALKLDRLRLDPPSFMNSAAAVAAAMGTDLASAIQARAIGLPEYDSWCLLLLSARCGCSPAKVFEGRKSKSWGEMAEAQGTTWPELTAEAERRAAAAGLAPMQPTPAQLARSWRNVEDGQ